MIVHSDVEIGFWLALLVGFGAAVSLVISGILVLERKFRTAASVAKTTLSVMVVWVIAVSLVSLLTPQTIVRVGDNYCEEIRCIGIDKVRVEPKEPETVYDQGRRFPLIGDPAVIPYDTYLDPGQKIQTTLTFVAASDARQLFLTFRPRSKAEGAKLPAVGKTPPAWATLPFGLLGAWFYVASPGRDDAPLHKPTVLRVL